MLRKYYTLFIAFFDRNCNLLFNGRNCIKIAFYQDWFKYNDIVTEGLNDFRCLGNGWYVKKVKKA